MKEKSTGFLSPVKPLPIPLSWKISNSDLIESRP
jgi:hypothetical protein